MIEAVNAGLTIRGQIARQYLGLPGQAVDRTAANQAARAKNLSLKFSSNENFIDTPPVASWIANATSWRPRLATVSTFQREAQRACTAPALRAHSSPPIGVEHQWDQAATSAVTYL